MSDKVEPEDENKEQLENKTMLDENSVKKANTPKSKTKAARKKEVAQKPARISIWGGKLPFEDALKSPLLCFEAMIIDPVNEGAERLGQGPLPKLTEMIDSALAQPKTKKKKRRTVTISTAEPEEDSQESPKVESA
jgi:hypothetical protein